MGGNSTGYITKLLVNLLWFGQVVATVEAGMLASKIVMNLNIICRTLAASPGSSAFVRNDLR